MKKSLLCVLVIFSCIVAEAQLIPADSAGKYVGQTITAYGKVVDGRYLSGPGKSPTLLNMGAKYPNQKLTVVIYGENRVNFGYQPEVALINKVIYVKGKVDLYDDKPQIVVSTPFDISFNPPPGTVFQAPVASAKPTEKTAGRNKEIQAPKARIEDVKVEDATPAKEKNTAKVKEVKPGAAAVSQPVIGQQQQPAAVTVGEMVLGNSISLKGGPGNKFITIGSLKKGTSVTVLSSQYGWAKVAERTNENPLMGYVKVENLQRGN
jgi:hypothetical protein